MNNKEFAAALKKMPCPECSTVGHLECQQMHIKATHNGQTIEASGEGTICVACNVKFMGDDLTESLANQVHRIDGGANKFIEVDRGTGELKGHYLQ